MKQAAAWAAAGGLTSLAVGLTREEAAPQAEKLLALLHGTQVSTSQLLDQTAIDVLRAACTLLEERGKANLGQGLEDAHRLYDFISGAWWPEPNFEEKAELLCDCAFWAWRTARRGGKPGETSSWLQRFGLAVDMSSPLRTQLDEVSRRLASGAQVTAADLQPDTLMLLLAHCIVAPQAAEAAPSTVRRQTSLLYRLFEGSQYRISDAEEHDYILGELALVNSAACRVLSRRTEAKAWLSRAEKNFGLSFCSEFALGRLAYHRLALRIEEREFAGLVDEIRDTRLRLLRSAMDEEALRFRFLEGCARWELGEFDEAILIFREAVLESKAIGNLRFMAQASTNLFQLYARSAQVEKAVAQAMMAQHLLEQVDNRIGLVKLRRGVGDLMWSQGRIENALEVYRLALVQAEDLGLRGDAVELHLVLADLLIERGEMQEAKREIKAAIPSIELEKMVPEGMAAFSLLRESISQQRVNRQALRDLHGFFRGHKE